MGSRPPAMSDVAQLAGVSHQTVSRVLNGHASVRPATRDRVLEAVRTLGYRPNIAARSLASRRSGIIGVLAMETALYGPSSTVYALERAARSAGYFVSVAATDADGDVEPAEALERLVLLGVEGIVAIAPVDRTSEAISSFAMDVPIVAVQCDQLGLPHVYVDQIGGAELAVRHLINEGGATVWHIAGPQDWFEARGRLTGWQRALHDAGLDAPPPLVGDWSPRSGYELGQRLATNADVRAVFVANDQMALGVLRAFHEAGVAVPDDVLVAGFDDTPEAAFFTPPLTTVRQDFLAVGRRAIELLIVEMREPSSSAQSVAIPTELVSRQSTVGHRRTISGTRA